MSSKVEVEVDAQLNWMQSLLNSSASQANQSSNTNKSSNQIDQLLESIENSTTEQKCASPSKVQFNIQPECVDSCGSSYLTGKNPPKAEPQYRISDTEYSDEDSSECEEYYVDDAQTIRGQEIPSWARAQNLLQELEKQKKVDPDTIFVGFEKSCDLNSMFEKKKKSFKVRGDSGFWATDNVTPDEELKYKKALGYV